MFFFKTFLDGSDEPSDLKQSHWLLYVLPFAKQHALVEIWVFEYLRMSKGPWTI